MVTGIRNGDLRAERAKKSEEGAYPITMEASLPRIWTKSEDRMRQGEGLRSRNERTGGRIVPYQRPTPFAFFAALRFAHPVQRFVR